MLKLKLPYRTYFPVQDNLLSHKWVDLVMLLRPLKEFSAASAEKLKQEITS